MKQFNIAWQCLTQSNEILRPKETDLKINAAFYLGSI